MITCAGQYRAGGERKNEGEGMTAALRPARIGNPGWTAQQNRVFFSSLGRPDSSEPTQAR
ncbi:hypothetical protein QF026_008280 [Streptomyces aurantiacus]|uniref:hypothetical protein n=1 Tax=Streptomyces aurantiacus TaxID=47760 RepID=UPI002791E1CE|nr:hypothetical protein [Streptomyces aurantiacus]MDQ0779814.1 hypothetical protein [Streptomyces aurantiacus]